MTHDLGALRRARPTAIAVPLVKSHSQYDRKPRWEKIVQGHAEAEPSGG